MKTDLFDYKLPPELIAKHPPTRREDARLLVLGEHREIEHSRVSSLGDHLPDGAVLVCNDTRVVPARLRTRRPTGGAVEVLLIRPVVEEEKSCEWLALASANKPLRKGDSLLLGGGIVAEVVGKGERGGVTLRFDVGVGDLRAHMEAHGEVPLPPYIRRAVVDEDRERYQTVFARNDGSVAAPTAGLHFTDRVLQGLQTRGISVHFVTLHVGPGTFRPITADSLDDHRMDEEHYTIGAEVVDAIDRARAEGRMVVAVGTTVVRALEGCAASLGRLEAASGYTDIFIAPPYEFRVVDGLLTNFHLPRSTLLCLVSALAGRERIMAAYEEAVVAGYRFYSYGDAMIILPEKR